MHDFHSFLQDQKKLLTKWKHGGDVFRAPDGTLKEGKVFQWFIVNPWAVLGKDGFAEMTETLLTPWEKTCPRCGEVVGPQDLLRSFHKNDTRGDGFEYVCARCKEFLNKAAYEKRAANKKQKQNERLAKYAMSAADVLAVSKKIYKRLTAIQKGYACSAQRHSLVLTEEDFAAAAWARIFLMPANLPDHLYLQVAKRAMDTLIRRERRSRANDRAVEAEIIAEYRRHVLPAEATAVPISPAKVSPI